MILNSLTLNNIRSYDHKMIKFPKGITLFEGDVGSGKSTILMAIEFALFGPGAQNLRSLLSKSASKGHMILNFTVDDKIYEIKRAIQRDPKKVPIQDPKNTILKSDKEEQLSMSELKQRILNILKFNEPNEPRAISRIYRYAVFTPQEEMKVILLDKSKRIETIRRAFQIDAYSTARNNIKDILRTVKIESKNLEKEFEALNELKQDKKEIEKELKQYSIKIEKYRKEHKEYTRKKLLYEKKIEELNNKDKERTTYLANEKSTLKNIKNTELEMKKINVDINEMNTKILKIIKKQKKINVNDVYDKTEEELSRILLKLNTCETELKNKKAGINFSRIDIQKYDKNKLESDIYNLKNKHEELNQKKCEYESNIEELNYEKKKIESNIERLNDEISKIKKLGPKCATCFQSIEKKYSDEIIVERERNIKNNGDELAKNSKIIQCKNEEYENLVCEIDVINKKIDENEQIISQLDDLERNELECNEIKKKIEIIKQQNIVPKKQFNFPTTDMIKYVTELKKKTVQYNVAKLEYDKYETNINNLNENIEKQKQNLENNTKQCNEHKSNYKNIIDQLSKLPNYDKELQTNHKKITKTDEIIQSIIKNKASVETNITNKKNIYAQNNDNIKKSEKIKKLHERVTEYIIWLETFFIQSLEQIEKQVLLSYKQQFSEKYLKLYSILIDDSTKISDIDEDFSPCIEQDGYEQSVDYLSGGEKTSIALSYRLALNSLIRNETESLKSNLLILDEPTDGFSRSQLEKMRDVLQDMNSKQIILVSHENVLESCSNTIFKVSKTNGISEIISDDGIN